MDLDFVKHLISGFVSGLTDILPVSASAHEILLQKIFGSHDRAGLPSLLIHLAVFAAIYVAFQNQIAKVARARALARIPKKRRKRPLDTKSLMDFRFWRTMIIPVLLAYLLYGKISGFRFSFVFLSFLLCLNGILLYIPQFFPGSNKDCRSLSRLEGIIMGLGGAVSVLPGLSGIGASVSLASICGVDKGYGLSLTILMEVAAVAALIVYDILAIISDGIGALSAMLILQDFLGAALAFAGAYLGIQIMRNLAKNAGYSVFAYYCWGLALFALILNLMA